ncbi:hypothetical protein [Prosthecochloris sp. CIB 2401]|uniref:hypothetical protein n=1 Tax=Prosthecochloris sp. CIB 2401 TaxID=1868325 RepID=UPI00080AA5C2|nr:hypothetical protein [Prosthecochloris sp. CIB 2401]ANT65975.1 hypothetical protein Ptc2401_02250 [Prosthecochloris sp. CIB 2401]
MANYEIKKFNISDILLDQKNPRFEQVNNQREAIKAMLVDQGDKIVALAKDIYTNGLDPSKRMIVFKENGQFVDGDGNRRLTAIKILETPSLAKASSNINKKIDALLKNSKGSIPTEIDCVVFQDRASAAHWIEINHAGQQEGRGQIPWDSEQTERFLGKISIGIAAMNLLIKEGKLTHVNKNSINKTTADRVLGFKSTKNALSITTNGLNFVFGNVDRLAVLLNALINKSVDVVYTADKTELFLNQLFGTIDPESHENTKSGTSPKTIDSSPGNGNDVSKSPSSKSKPAKRTPRSTPSKEPLFGNVLQLKSGIVNDIYCDICDIYNADFRKQNTCIEILGMSMRLLLDVAAKEYYESNPDPKVKDDAKYRSYLKVIKDQLCQSLKNTLSVDSNIKGFLSEGTLEAHLGKLAHGNIHCTDDTLKLMAKIIGPILEIHFKEESI